MNKFDPPLLDVGAGFAALDEPRGCAGGFALPPGAADALGEELALCAVAGAPVGPATWETPSVALTVAGGGTVVDAAAAAEP